MVIIIRHFCFHAQIILSERDMIGCVVSKFIYKEPVRPGERRDSITEELYN